MIRILVVGPSLDITGGQSIQAHRLIERLSQEPGIEVELLPINPRLPGALRFLQRIKYVRTIVTTLLFLATLLWKIGRFDIAHVFAAAYSSFLLSATPAIVIAKLFGKKVVLNYHDGQAEDHLANWRSALPVIRRVDRVAVPSQFLVAVFGKFGVEATAIFNIIDTGRFAYRHRRRLRPAFLHNRGMEPLYNIPCTLRAFSMIQQSYPEATLTMAHDGPLRQQLEALAGELGLRNVNFIGAVPSSSMPAVYDAADVYIMSPNIDNMPNSILECFSAGLPIVSTNAGGIPYIADHERTALLVELNDHAGLAQGALRLLGDERLAGELSQNGRAESQRYEWAAVRAEWLKLYRGLA